MFFLVKSVCWLGLVFYFMSWPGGERPEHLARQAAGEMASRVQTAAVDTAVSHCKSDPAACLALASNATRSSASPARPALRGTMAE